MVNFSGIVIWIIVIDSVLLILLLSVMTTTIMMMMMTTTTTMTMTMMMMMVIRRPSEPVIMKSFGTPEMSFLFDLNWCNIKQLSRVTQISCYQLSYKI